MATINTAREAAQEITALYDSYDQFAAVAKNGCGEWEIDRAAELAEKYGLLTSQITDEIEAICRERCKLRLYVVRRYSDNQAVGSADLTAEQFARYESMAQQPQGLIALGDMPHDLYDLRLEYKDLGPDTTIYLD